MLRFLFHTSVILILTILTQLGGLAWLIACFFRQRLAVFAVTYAMLSIGAVWVAPSFGRVALNCFDDGPLEVQNLAYCALNRTYVSQQMAEVLTRTANAMEQRHPGTKTLALDGNFPFLTGFPLLPHLSHDDGEKVDLAFYYEDETGYAPGKTRSPLGYFAFEEGPTPCPRIWPSLRWNMDALQPLWADLDLNIARNRDVLQVLAADPAVGKIFVEPHLTDRLGVAHPKIRFQGCRAARHDDHIHFQLN